MDKKLTLLDFAINSIFVLLALLMPIFFLPITVEFFEFNKLTLLIALTAVGLVVWAVKLLVKQKNTFPTSTLDLPMATLIVSFIVSTVFSLDKTSSVIGSQGRWFPGVLSIITLVIYYYLLATNLKTVYAAEKLINILIGSITLGSVVSILSYLGIYLGPQAFFQAKNFSLTGSTTTAVLLATLVFVLSIKNLIRTDSIVSRIFTGIALLINFLFVALVNSVIGWCALGAGLLFMIFQTDSNEFKNNKWTFAVLGTILWVIAGFATIPYTRNLFAEKNFPYEVTLPISESWIIATSSLRDYPIVGTGPSTFYLNYTRYKSLALNSTNLWNVRLDKPFNEVFNVLSTIGLVGLLVFMFLGSRIIKLAKQPLAEDKTFGSLLNIGILMLISFMFLTYATVLTSFALFTLLGIKVGLSNGVDKDELAEDVIQSISSISTLSVIGNKIKMTKEYYHVISSIVFVAVAFVGGFIAYQVYMGEYFMKKSVEMVNNNDGGKTYEYQAKAINFNPKRDMYHNAYAQTNLALASAISSKKELSEEDKQTVQTLINQAIRSTRISTELLVPTNVVGWETTAIVHKSIIGIEKDADKLAIDAYNNAIILDPNNPKLRLDLGGIYFTNKDYIAAANLFKQAAALKGDYANAYYNFAMAAVGVKDYDNAKRSLEIVKTLVTPESEDYKIATTELDKIKNLKTETPENNGNVAGASTVKDGTRPTIVPTNQEPLNPVSESSPAKK